MPILNVRRGIYVFFLAGLIFGPGWSYEVELKVNFELKQISGLYYFVVWGTTDLPDGVMLLVEIQVPYQVPSEDDPNRMEKEVRWIEDGFARVKNGRFKIALGGYRRRPYSVGYEAVVTYDPKDQPAGISSRLKDIGRFEKLKPGRFGTEQDLQEEIKLMLDEFRRDFLKIHAIYQQIRREFLRYYQDTGLKLKGWEEATQAWYSRLKKIEEFNEQQRLGMWILTRETQGIIFVNELCSWLRELIKTCSEELRLRDPTRKISAEASSMMRGFETRYNDSFDFMGFDMQIDPVRFGPPFRRVLAELERLKGICERWDKAEWDRAKEDIQRVCAENLMVISSDITRRWYSEISEIMLSFQGLYQLCEERLARKRSDPALLSRVSTLLDQVRKLMQDAMGQDKDDK
jgi:hypothetical protein